MHNLYTHKNWFHFPQSLVGARKKEYIQLMVRTQFYEFNGIR